MLVKLTEPAHIPSIRIDQLNNSTTHPAEGQQLRILMLLTQMEAGGSQKAAIKLTHGLEAQGHQVTIATMYDKGTYVSDFRQQHNVDMVNLRFQDMTRRGLFARFTQTIRGVGRLWQMMRKGHYDVLMTYTPYSNIFGPIIGWAAGIPVRVTSQRSLMDTYPGWVRTLDRGITNSRLVDTMTSVSRAVRDYSVDMEKIHPSKIITIYTGIETESYRQADKPTARKQVRDELGLDDSHIIVITVARLYSVKGHIYLVDAVRQIMAGAPQCRFLFAGEGPLREAIEGQIRDAGLTDKVMLLGVRDDVPHLLLAADIFALPSLGEGLPNVVLEAMAAGLPVVTTDVGGNSELVIDGETGLLVPPGESDALAEGILKLVSNRSDAAKMGDRGRARVVVEFTAEQTVSRYAELFLKLLAGKQPPTNRQDLIS